MTDISMRALPAHSDGPEVDEAQLPILVGEYPARAAGIHPDKPALIFKGRRTSYVELDQAASRFASVMRLQGLRAGDRIAWLGKNSDLFFIALFGSIRGGFVLVPIGWRSAPGEVAFILADASVRILFHDSALNDLAERAFAMMETVPKALAVEGAAGSLDELLRSEGAEDHREPADPAAIILQVYTSGTTGRPKGVLLSHHAMSMMRHLEARALVPESDWTADHVLMTVLPIAHVAGIGWPLIALRAGMSCVVTDDPGAGNIVGLARQEGVTHILMVPTVIRSVIDHIEASGVSLPPLRVIHYGAAPIDLPLLQKCIAMWGCSFGQHFGMTEVSGTALFLGAAEHDPARPDLLRSKGRPLPGMGIEIRDREGNIRNLGEPGEIWLRTPAVMSGYWNLPEETRAALVGGWYRTGDGGYLDSEGYLYLTDRIKDIIITGGENVYPAEIEALLRQHPAISDIAVVGLPDERWGEAVTAIIEWMPGKVATRDELRGFAREHLSAYKCPKQFRIIDALPRTSVGKVQRKAALQQAADLPVLG